MLRRHIRQNRHAFIVVYCNCILRHKQKLFVSRLLGELQYYYCSFCSAYFWWHAFIYSDSSRNHFSADGHLGLVDCLAQSVLKQQSFLHLIQHLEIFWWVKLCFSPFFLVSPWMRQIFDLIYARYYYGVNHAWLSSWFKFCWIKFDKICQIIQMLDISWLKLFSQLVHLGIIFGLGQQPAWARQLNDYNVSFLGHSRLHFLWVKNQRIK